MKPLPSLKPKKRYIVFEILHKVEFSPRAIEKAVKGVLEHYLGVFGMARAEVMFLPKRCKSNKFILKMSHKSADEVRCAIVLLTKIDTRDVGIRSVVTSGTLKKTEAYL